MALFKVPERANRLIDTQLAKKANSKSTTSSITSRGNRGLVDRINVARAIVEKNLGRYRDLYTCIQDEDVLERYIDKAIENNRISIDTETTGLDPLRDTLVGISIYTPGEKPAYIPLAHKSFITNELVPGQLSTSIVHEQFSRLKDTFMIMFNACFDIRVLRHGIGVSLKCSWDCYLAARLLNENEGPGNSGLKALHKKYCDDGEEVAAKFSDMFEGISFDMIPINMGYLYAAHDAVITDELYDFQRQFLVSDAPRCIEQGLIDVAWVFNNIEMPCVEVVADMEDVGVDFDFEVADNLHEVYHKRYEEAQMKVYQTLDKYEDAIALMRPKNSKLSDPINLDSPTQIAILLYDIMKVGEIDKKSPRGTGEAILAKIDNDFTKALLEYREIGKLINTYIDKLPNCVNPDDGRIHCKFNQYGADTGRFSSSDPNLQNIPSHNKDIRKMFKATDEENIIDISGGSFTISAYDEVFTDNGFIKVSNLIIGNKLLFEDESVGVVTKIIKPVDKNQYIVYYT